MLRKLVSIAALAACLGGCANWMAVHYTRDMPENRVLGIDSDQRTIITGDFSDDRALCAEPSPDTTSVLAFAASANLTRQEAAQVQAAIAASESAMNIGLRTPTIQLLRDGMYRLCEAYMNGAIDRARYTVLINRYQQMMIGLVAIEQLTGVVRTSQNRISAGQASTNASMAAQRIDAIAQARHIEQQITSINTRLREIGNPPAEAADEAQSVRDRRAERDRLNAQLAIWTASLDAQNKAIATVSATPPAAPSTVEAEAGEGATGAADNPSNSNDTITSDITEAVYWITNDTISGNLSEFTCLPAYSHLFRQPETEVVSDGLDDLRRSAIESCIEMATAEADDMAEQQQTRASESNQPGQRDERRRQEHSDRYVDRAKAPEGGKR